jgi:phospholipase C
MSQNCQQVSAGRYAARHNPAVYFLPVRSRCDQWDVRMGGAGGAFATALADNRLAAFSFVTPNLCSDGHDCSLATADAWLGTWLDRIVTSRAYAAGHTVVFVTWDEDDSAHANHVATIVIGPTVPPGTRASGSFTHYSLLRTTESILGLAHLRNAATAHGMRGAFHL